LEAHLTNFLVKLGHLDAGEAGSWASFNPIEGSDCKKLKKIKVAI
jgi:hypothetical protein